MKKELTIAALFLSGCVTVDMGAQKTEQAKKVQFKEPSAPFESTSNKSSDRFWISQNTGNSITYVSECGGTQEPSLEQLETDALSALTDMKIFKTDKISYNQREALQSSAAGKLDGVPVRMNLLNLKKNGCNYTLVYTGVEKNFEKETAHFNQFLESFKAP